ncbi:MAG: hypothetical protein ACE5EK_04825, partial [Nitrospinales bacterium]
MNPLQPMGVEAIFDHLQPRFPNSGGFGADALLDSLQRSKHHSRDQAAPSFRMSIRTKLLSSFFLILVLISGFVFYYYPQQHRNFALHTLENKVKSMAELIALGVGIGMNTSNFNAISEALNWAKRDPDLQFIIVFDQTGKAYAAHPEAMGTADLATFSRGVLIADGGRALHVKVPIRYQGISYGTLVLGFSLETVQASVDNNRTD